MGLINTLLYFAAGHILVWLQLHGQYIFESWKANIWPAILISPIPAYFFITATQKGFEYYENFWGPRLTGFVAGITVFTFMTYIAFGEGITPKTAVCLVLCALIMLIQALV